MLCVDGDADEAASNPARIAMSELAGSEPGVGEPTVEEGETDFDTLGIKFRVYFDLGVRETPYAATRRLDRPVDLSSNSIIGMGHETLSERMR